jgi:hypothetical protein
MPAAAPFHVAVRWRPAEDTVAATLVGQQIEVAMRFRCCALCSFGFEAA